MVLEKIATWKARRILFARGFVALTCQRLEFGLLPTPPQLVVQILESCDKIEPDHILVRRIMICKSLTVKIRAFKLSFKR
jgi:hypothetical protein